MSLTKEVRTGLAKLDLSKKSLRKFGLIAALFFGIFSIIGIVKSGINDTAIIFALLSGCFLIAAFLFPRQLQYIYRPWMAVALIIGFFISRTILSLVFVAVITPLRFVLNLVGKDLLDKKIQEESASYWKRREKNRDGLEGIERQF